jgi:hypothetical protein
MKAILSMRRRDHVARVGTFLLLVALIAGVVGCGGGVGPPEGGLTPSISPLRREGG